MRSLVILLIGAAMLPQAAASECTLGHAPGALKGVPIGAGKAKPLGQPAVTSLKNLGERAIAVTLSLRGQPRQLTLPPGRREPADAALSLAAGTRLLSARCLGQSIDLTPITRGRDAATVFRVLMDTSRSAVVGGQGDQPVFAPFYRVSPDALCGKLPAPGRYRVGAKVSPPRTVTLAPLTWGVTADGARPAQAIRIRLAGGARAPQEVTVPPGQFRQTGPRRFKALYRTARQHSEVRVHRLGADAVACWVQADFATYPSDNGVLVAVDTTNAVVETREDNNQQPYGLSTP